MREEMRAVTCCSYSVRVRMRFFLGQHGSVVTVSASRRRRQQGAAPEAIPECSRGFEGILAWATGRRLRGSVVSVSALPIRGRPYWRVLQWGCSPGSSPGPAGVPTSGARALPPGRYRRPGKRGLIRRRQRPGGYPCSVRPSDRLVRGYRTSVLLFRGRPHRRALECERSPSRKAGLVLCSLLLLTLLQLTLLLLLLLVPLLQLMRPSL